MWSFYENNLKDKFCHIGVSEFCKEYFFFWVWYSSKWVHITQSRTVIKFSAIQVQSQLFLNRSILFQYNSCILMPSNLLQKSKMMITSNINIVYLLIIFANSWLWLVLPISRLSLNLYFQLQLLIWISWATLKFNIENYLQFEETQIQIKI